MGWLAGISELWAGWKACPTVGETLLLEAAAPGGDGEAFDEELFGGSGGVFGHLRVAGLGAQGGVEGGERLAVLEGREGR